MFPSLVAERYPSSGSAQADRGVATKMGPPELQISGRRLADAIPEGKALSAHRRPKGLTGSSSFVCPCQAL